MKNLKVTPDVTIVSHCATLIYELQCEIEW